MKYHKAGYVEPSTVGAVDIRMIIFKLMLTASDLLRKMTWLACRQRYWGIISGKEKTANEESTPKLTKVSLNWDKQNILLLGRQKFCWINSTKLKYRIFTKVWKLVSCLKVRAFLHLCTDYTFCKMRLVKYSDLFQPSINQLEQWTKIHPGLLQAFQICCDQCKLWRCILLKTKNIC